MASLLSTFSGFVKDLREELLCYKRLRNNKNDMYDSLTWNRVCYELLAMLQQYPAGVSRAVVVSELDRNLSSRLRTAQRSVTSKPCFSKTEQTIDEVMETDQVSNSAVIRCQLRNWYKMSSVQTKIAELEDRNGSGCCIPMFLHEKLNSETFDELMGAEMLFTGLKLYRQKHTHKLTFLPTEYCILLLDDHGHDTFLRKFDRNLNNIMKKCHNTTSTHCHDVILEVVSKQDVQIDVKMDGSSTRKVVFDLIDIKGQDVQMFFFEQDVVFEKMINEGDRILCKNILATVVDGRLLLEYGPPTTLFLIPFRCEKETFCSQISGQVIGEIEKTKQGKRDFQKIGCQTFLADLNGEYQNGCCLALIKGVSDTSDGYVDLEVQDESCSKSVHVTQMQPCDKSKLNCGDLMFLHGINTSGELDVLDLGRGSAIIDIATLNGFIASPHLYQLSSISRQMADGVYFVSGLVKELIINVKPLDTKPSQNRATANQYDGFCCTLQTETGSEVEAFLSEKISKQLSLKIVPPTANLIDVWQDALTHTTTAIIVICLTVHDGRTTVNNIAPYFPS